MEVGCGWFVRLLGRGSAFRPSAGGVWRVPGLCADRKRLAALLPRPLPRRPQAYGLTVADLKSDGTPDIITVSQQESTASHLQTMATVGLEALPGKRSDISMVYGTPYRLWPGANSRSRWGRQARCSTAGIRTDLDPSHEVTALLNRATASYRLPFDPHHPGPNNPSR